ncbi:hypothetical protein C0995_014436 [Termitomyces sp. Mi166|nr:hypothetical protein C0995_014436 [Termitomyces sp. Mi166\
MSLNKAQHDYETPGPSSSHTSSGSDKSDIDILSYHEKNAGRLIIDPEEVTIELGENVASQLKLTKDGTKVLWPQPTDSPNDPQNWSDWRKTVQLIIITLAAIVPDFDSGIGWGGLFAVMLMRRYGRLPVLFWSQVLALGFLIGTTFAPTLKIFTGSEGQSKRQSAIRRTNQSSHALDVQLNLWTMGFIISPFLSPFAFGFLVARASWRWAYGIGSIYSAFVVLLIVFFGEETIYDRTVKPIPEPPTRGLHYRIETLIGITGVKMAKYRPSWKESILSPFNVIWRPHLMMILWFEAMLFGFSIGINGTNPVFLGSPRPFGYGFGPFAIAGGFGTPIVAVVIGELVGRYLNDWIMNTSIRRNNGVFEAESRLWYRRSFFQARY